MSDFEEKFKEALDFLEVHPLTSPNKPALPHVKRVGQYLYEKGFSDDVVNAGLLHDSLEWSQTSEEELKEKFGNKILEIIKANSKNTSIEGTINRAVDMMERCKKVGDGAMAIKIADVYDSCNYYTKLKNEKELKDYKIFVKLLLENLSDNLKKIFLEDLNKIFV
ncbi:HD domain-containing protein [Patescibacteria group bacterium]|nr:HD domain-containing protein [Patescibacteria group bacterium]